MNIIHLTQNSSISSLTGNEIVDLSILQGKTYSKLFLFYPQDLSLGNFYGQIRKEYYQDNGELLAEFDFESPIYDPIENKTLIKPFISAAITQNIPYTKYQGIGSPNIKNCWVYDIEHHLGDVVTPISQGFVQVIPEVTRW